MEKKIKFYYSLATYINFGAISILTTFYIPYLNQVVGLSLNEIGKVVSIGALFAIFSQSILVNKLSGSQNKKRFIIIHLVAVIFMIVLLMYINKNKIYFFAILYGLIIQTIVTVYEIYVEELSVKQRMEYSQIRKWGSIGFGCIVILSGIIISKYGFRIVHLMGILMITILIFIIAIKFKNLESRNKRNTTKLINILKNRNALILGGINLLAIGTYNSIEFAYSAYLVEIVGNTNLANSLYSKSIGMRVFIEFIAFMFVGKFFRKGHYKKYLIIAFSIAALRILLFSTAYVPLVILGDQLHGIMFACYLTFLFKYIREVVTDELVAGTFSFVSVLSSAGASFIYPQMFSIIQGKFGYSSMYLMGFSIIVIALLVSIKILPEKKSKIKISEI
jgi:OHS family lactose permease-like MFS transporter